MSDLENARAADIQFAELLKLLRADVEFARTELYDMPDDHPQKQAKLRSYVRTAFALIEGVSYAIRMRTVNWNKIPMPTKLSTDEVDELSEEKKFLKFEDAIKRGFKLATKQRGINFQLNCNCPGWTALKAALEIRHKLTHPKNVRELEIEPGQIGSVVNGLQWFFDEYARFVNLAGKGS